MSDPYERVKGGRLTFKGGSLATLSKGIEKKRKKKKKPVADTVEDAAPVAENLESDAGEIIYTIDAAKKMKYEELFPVETKKFGYSEKKDLKSVEDALDDRVKKKADQLHMNAMSFPKRCKWVLPLPNLMADQICVARVLILTLLSAYRLLLKLITYWQKVLGSPYYLFSDVVIETEDELFPDLEMKL
ncbi:hypothetical protein POTOM_017059 [Populus tomentosa]|uniref:Uncharacterized protein n=1 Tax=Populus tomentosa TaxID=118781 RepID=A0A8X7ZZQ8_POPTO|nr:hypothetical protein POTOM_017059 [Populus tomentosa]